MTWFSQFRLEQFVQLLFGQHAHVLRLDDTVLEQAQCRDAAYAVLHGRALAGFHSDLGIRQAMSVFVGHLLEDASAHLAGTAPLRPEIKENRATGLQYPAVETVVGNVLYAHDPLYAHGVMSDREYGESN